MKKYLAILLSLLGVACFSLHPMMPPVAAQDDPDEFRHIATFRVRLPEDVPTYDSFAIAIAQELLCANPRIKSIPQCYALKHPEFSELYPTPLEQRAFLREAYERTYNRLLFLTPSSEEKPYAFVAVHASAGIWKGRFPNDYVITQVGKKHCAEVRSLANSSGTYKDHLGISIEGEGCNKREPGCFNIVHAKIDKAPDGSNVPVLTLSVYGKAGLSSTKSLLDSIREINITGDELISCVTPMLNPKLHVRVQPLPELLSIEEQQGQPSSPHVQAAHLAPPPARQGGAPAPVRQSALPSPAPAPAAAQRAPSEGAAGGSAISNLMLALRCDQCVQLAQTQAFNLVRSLRSQGIITDCQHRDDIVAWCAVNIVDMMVIKGEGWLSPQAFTAFKKALLEAKLRVLGSVTELPEEVLSSYRLDLRELLYQGITPCADHSWRILSDSLAADGFQKADPLALLLPLGGAPAPSAGRLSNFPSAVAAPAAAQGAPAPVRPSLHHTKPGAHVLPVELSPVQQGPDPLAPLLPSPPLGGAPAPSAGRLSNLPPTPPAPAAAQGAPSQGGAAGDMQKRYLAYAEYVKTQAKACGDSLLSGQCETTIQRTLRDKVQQYLHTQQSLCMQLLIEMLTRISGEGQVLSSWISRNAKESLMKITDYSGVQLQVLDTLEGDFRWSQRGQIILCKVTESELEPYVKRLIEFFQLPRAKQSVSGDSVMANATPSRGISSAALPPAQQRGAPDRHASLLPPPPPPATGRLSVLPPAVSAPAAAQRVLSQGGAPVTTSQRPAPAQSDLTPALKVAGGLVMPYPGYDYSNDETDSDDSHSTSRPAQAAAAQRVLSQGGAPVTTSQRPAPAQSDFTQALKVAAGMATPYPSLSTGRGHDSSDDETDSDDSCSMSRPAQRRRKG